MTLITARKSLLNYKDEWVSTINACLSPLIQGAQRLIWNPDLITFIKCHHPWRRKLQPTPVFLPGEFHGQKSLVGYSPWGRKESDRTERLSTCTQQTLMLKMFVNVYAFIFSTWYPKSCTDLKFFKLFQPVSKGLLVWEITSWVWWLLLRAKFS